MFFKKKGKSNPMGLSPEDRYLNDLSQLEALELKKREEISRKEEQLMRDHPLTSSGRIVTTREKQNALVEEIHQSFDSASEEALKEAQKIISTISLNEVALLKKELGFTRAAGVLENEGSLRKKQRLEEKIQMFSYYQQYYPQYKFIQEDAVKDLCIKYSLALGDASLYQGDIPMKNLLEIKNFDKNSIKEFDQVYIIWSHGYARAISNTEYNSMVATGQLLRMPQQSFHICAPASEMNMQGKILANGYQIIDALVLYPVRGGYIIVSKWGKEGEDPSLVNEKAN